MYSPLSHRQDTLIILRWQLPCFPLCYLGATQKVKEPRTHIDSDVIIGTPGFFFSVLKETCLFHIVTYMLQVKFDFRFILI